MRFHRIEWCEFQDTKRRRAAFAIKQRREREALPLFAEQIAGEQISVDAEMAKRAATWSERQREDRAHRAAQWRRARGRLAGYELAVRSKLLAYWTTCGWPGDPVYLLTMLHMFDNGRLPQVKP